MDASRERHDGQVDGRRARRDRNKTAVLDAVVALFAEGDVSPGVHEVAARSGVSLRSVYRYFEDADDLITSAIDRQMERLTPEFSIPDVGLGSLDDRLARFARRRVALFETARDVHRAAVVRAARDERLRGALDRARGALDAQTRDMFAPELGELDDDRAEHVALALDLLTQLGSLERLRHEVGLSPDAVEAFLVTSIAALLAPDA